MDVTLPELGENITRATVLDVLVGAGDQVEKDQALLTLESDKAEFDLPSPEAGKIAEVLVARGDEIEVGQVIVRLEGEGAGATAKPAQKDGGRPTAAQAKDAPAQQTPADDTPAEDTMAEDAPAAPAKASRKDSRAAESPRPARSSATAAKPAGKTVKPTASDTAETVDPDAPDGAGEEQAGEVEQESPPARKSAAQPRAEQPKAAAPNRGAQREASSPPAPAAGDGSSQAPASGAERTPIAAAPSVRRLARELGVDVAEVARTASKDRVTAEDVYRYVRSRLAPGKTDAPAGDGAGRDYSRWGEVEEIPMSTVRRKTAERMSLAWSSIPHVTHHDLADITDLERLRKQYAPRVERAGGKLTITAVLLKVLGSALRKHPKFNASVDMERAVVVEKHFVNVGMAVDTERGLLVPVIQRVDEKNILELALELRDLSEAARARKIRPEQLQGATFTVTNLGGIGGTHFNPLINPPEVAVLGVSRSDLRQVWLDGRFEAREMLPLSVSYDHRIIDGADAARFLRWVCDALAEPFLMDLEGE